MRSTSDWCSAGTATVGSGIARSARRTRPCGRMCAPRSFRTDISAMNWTCADSTQSIRRSPACSFRRTTAPMNRRMSAAALKCRSAHRARTAITRSACRLSARMCWRMERGRSRKPNSASCWSIPTNWIWKRSCNGIWPAAARPVCAASPADRRRAQSKAMKSAKISCATVSVWVAKAPRTRRFSLPSTAAQMGRAVRCRQTAAR